MAKLAATPAKPGGVFLVPAGEEAAFLRTLRLKDIPGVGPALLNQLKEKGLETVDQAMSVEPEWLERWLGERRAHWLLARMRGEGSSEVHHGESRKSISSERTFGQDIDDDEELVRRLLQLTVGVTGTLRDKDFRARTLTVKLRDGDFTTRQRSHTFPEPVESDAIIFPVAKELLLDLRRKRRMGARLLGVGLSNLVEEVEPGQLAFFEDPEPHETDQTRALNQAVDGLRDRFGRDAVLPGTIVPSDHDPPRR